MERTNTSNFPLLNAKATTGVSATMNVEKFNYITVALTAPVNSAFTVKFQGSIGTSVTSESAPDFSAAQDVTNQWDYISAYDMNDPSSVIAGDTGVAITASTAASNTRLYTVNVSLIRHFSMSVTAISAGSVTAWCTNAN